MTPSYLINPNNQVTVAFPEDGYHGTIYARDDSFEDIIAAIKAQDWIKVRAIMEGPVKQLEESITALGDETIHIEHGIVYMDGEAIHNTVTDRMIAMQAAGFNIQPMKLFLVNLMSNPSFRAVQELYGFLEATELPITDDGHFLAYKKINNNYTDRRTGKMDNSIGATVRMQRNAVNDDQNVTCSTGLHFCGRAYLSHFSGDRIVVVKVNPRDVVSIPTDYNNAKGRACRYTIVQELAIETPPPSHSWTDDDDGVDYDLTGHDLTEVEHPEIEQLENLTVARPIFGVVIEQLSGLEVVNAFPNIQTAAEANNTRAEYIERVVRGDRKSTGGFGYREVQATSAHSVYELNPEAYPETSIPELEPGQMGKLNGRANPLI